MLNGLLRFLVSDKVLSNMKRLYPKWELSGRVKAYYKTKIKNSICILLAGLVICLVMYVESKNNTLIHEGKINRNNYMEGDKNIVLKYKTENAENEGEVTLNISEKKYKEEEISEIYERFENELFKTIVGNNSSLDCVTYDLHFVNSISGYPFTISYKTNRPLIISKDGIINQENLKSDLNYSLETGLDVKIIAEINYKNFKNELTFYACLFERKLSESEQFNLLLNSVLEECNIASEEEDFYYLPSSIDGLQIEFFEYNNKSFIYIFLMTLLVVILQFCFNDRQLEKEAEKKIEDLKIEYPSLINKFTLFYNAGMPVKSIWLKMCNDYLYEISSSGNRRYLYEEMLFTKKQIEDGVREIDAYEAFAKRVNLPEYRAFINIIIQAVQLGKKDLVICMKKECEDAFLNRKNNAKRLFEEAGTKLLMPMFMMLAIVFVIILFPAFYSFKL